MKITSYALQENVDNI